MNEADFAAYFAQTCHTQNLWQNYIDVLPKRAVHERVGEESYHGDFDGMVGLPEN